MTAATNPTRRDAVSNIAKKAERIEGKLLRRKPLTAGELAARAGYPSGRGLAKSLGLLVSQGRAIMVGGRRPTYLRPAPAV